MGDRILEFLIRAMKALHNGLLGVIRRHTTPPTRAEQQDTWTDRW